MTEISFYLLKSSNLPNLEVLTLRKSFLFFSSGLLLYFILLLLLLLLYISYIIYNKKNIES
jgi:hypothetical protein